MKDRVSALLCTGMLLFSQIGFTPALAETVPLTPSQVIDASSFSSTGDLTVESGQNVVVDFSNAPSGLQISGNLINNGNLFAVSTNGQSNSANFSALNITNTVGSLFTTNLPSGGILGFGNALSNLNLSLTASNNVINQGIISSAGNLNVSAGNAIINALPTNVSGPTPVMQALNNLNLFSGAGFLNQGVMSSVTSNINIASIANNLVFNNIGGQLQAYNAVNFRDVLYGGSGNVHLFGGEVIADQLNVFSGAGFADVNLSNLSAMINVSADATLIQTNNEQLSVGSLAVFDPSIYNTGGDIVINSPLNFPGEHLAIVAAGSIIAQGATVINTSATKAGNILIASGASITGVTGNSSPSHDSEDPPGGIYTFYPDGSQKQISFNSAAFTITGGNGKASAINLGNTVVNSSGTDSGNIIMVSFGGGISALGTLNAASAGGKAGNIQILAKGAIELGNINTSGGSAGSGSVLIESAIQPYAMAFDQATNTITQNVVVNNGQIIFGGFGPSDFVPNPFVELWAPNPVTVGNIESSGGDIRILTSGGSILTGNIFGADIQNATDKAQVVINNFAKNVFPSITTGDVTSTNINIVSAGALTTGHLTSLSGQLSVTASPAGDLNIFGSDVASVKVVPLTEGGSSNTRIDITYDGNASLNINEDLVITNNRSFGSSSTYIYSKTAMNVGNVKVFVQNGQSQAIVDAPSITFRAGSILEASGGAGGYAGVYTSSITSNGLTVSADGVAATGGTIDFLQFGPNGGNLTFNGSGTINLTANGPAGNGDIFVHSSGGFVFNGTSVAATAHGTNGLVFVLQDGSSLLEIGAATGFTSLQSNGTASGSGVGDAGTVLVISGGDLTADSAAISAAAGSGGGNGGIIDLEAGTSGKGTLKVNGDIHVDGNGTEGNGGEVYLLAPTIDIGSVVQRITADGSGNGNGGLVYIEAQDQEGSLAIGSNVRLSANGGSQGSSAGNGGSIQISSAKDLTVRPASVDVRVLGQNGDGGQIKLYSGFLGTSFEFNGTEFVEVVNHSETGTLALESGGLRADGTGTGNGGSVVVQGPTVNLNSGIGTVTLAARGIGEGNGGSILIKSVGENQALALGDLDTVVNLNSNGGINGSSGKGGKIEIESAADIVEQAGGSITATAAGLAGNGGEVSIKGSGTVQVLDNVTVLGGTTSGDGGNISIENDGSLIEIVGPLQADARGSGNGGKISITTSKGAGISIHDAENNSLLTSRGGISFGNGGSIEIDSSGSLNAIGVGINSSARGNGNGGNVEISASSNLTFSETVRSEGFGNGRGGSIRIQSQFGSVILSSSTETVLEVNSGNESGNGGEIDLSAGNDLTIVNGAIQGRGHNSGGSVKVSASNIFINSHIQVDATQSGTGGTLEILSPGTVELGNAEAISYINARGGLQNGGGGEVSISAKSIIVHSGISTIARGANGDGGQIFIEGINVLLQNGANSESRADLGNGGNITLLAESELTVNGDLNFSAYGDGNGGEAVLDPDNEGVRIFVNGDVLGIATRPGWRGGRLSNAGGPPDLIRLNNVSLWGAFGGEIILGKNDLGQVVSNTISVGNVSVEGLIGDGGIVHLYANKSVTVANINATGKLLGGVVHIESGSDMTAQNINVSSALGAGGSVLIKTNSPNPFIIGLPSANGISGKINVSGNTAGFGGTNFIYIEDLGNAGIGYANANSIVARTTTGKPSTIVLRSQGIIELPFGIHASPLSTIGSDIFIMADELIVGADQSITSTSNSGKGGFIGIASNVINFSGKLIIDAHGTNQGGIIDVGGEGSITVHLSPRTMPGSALFGDSIELISAPILGRSFFLQGDGPVVLNARGAQGGEIELASQETIGIMSGNVALNASSSSPTGNGGTVSIFAQAIDRAGGGILNVNVDGGSAGLQGAAGAVDIRTSTNLSVSTNGQLTISARGGREAALPQSGKVSLQSSAGDLLVETLGNAFRIGASQDRRGELLSFVAANKLSVNGFFQANGSGAGVGGNVTASAATYDLLFSTITANDGPSALNQPHLHNEGVVNITKIGQSTLQFSGVIEASQRIEVTSMAPSGNIVQGVTAAIVLKAPEIKITTSLVNDGSSVGTSLSPLQISTKDLTVTAGGLINVNNNSADSLSLIGKSLSNLTIATAGNIVVNYASAGEFAPGSPTSAGGEIFLSSQGSMNSSAGAQVRANGSITMNSKNGLIDLQASTRIIAYKANSQISLYVGLSSNAGLAQNQTPPENLIIDGGTVLLGDVNRIHATPPDNHVNAVSGSILINPGTGAGTVTVRGNVLIQSGEDFAPMGNLSYSRTKYIGDLSTDFADVYCNNDSFGFVEGETITISHGSIFVWSRKKTIVDAGEIRLCLEPGTVVRVDRVKGAIRVVNLHDYKANSCVVITSENRFAIPAGVQVGVNDKELSPLPKRRINDIEQNVESAEISISYLLSKDKLSRRVLSLASNNHLRKRIEKLAATMMLVTGNHGPYLIHNSPLI